MNDLPATDRYYLRRAAKLIWRARDLLSSHFNPGERDICKRVKDEKIDDRRTCVAELGNDTGSPIIYFFIFINYSESMFICILKQARQNLGQV